MAFLPHSRLGAYELLSPLGSGGMGEVYRARDTRLGREVAIKVLPAEVSGDERRRHRFLHEARTLSSLNHPHIVAIHEIDSDGDVDFMVMELVRGTTLDRLMPARGLSHADLLRIAVPLADALTAAHDRGIIHRDLKPANVMVADDGVVKLLDFGVARMTDTDDDPQPQTATDLQRLALSAPGRIAGTVAYMSPEQATGARLDARTDVFSFGALLYEMATGVRAFKGSSAAETLAAIVEAPPTPPKLIVASVPRRLERLILRCLRKEPERRYQRMLDVQLELQDLKEEYESAAPLSWTTLRRRQPLVAAVALSTALLAGAAGSQYWARDGATSPPLRVIPLTAMDGSEMAPTLSPGGDQVAFAWNGDAGSGNVDVYVMMVGSPTVHRLTTDPAMDLFPRWSSDGRRIAFVRRVSDHAGRVYVTSPLGGPEQKLSDFDVHFDRVAAFGQLSWSPDDRYLAAARPSTQRAGDSTGIYLLPTGGGTPRRITGATAPASDRDPAISPDGHRLAYFACSNCCWGGCDVMVLDVDADLVRVSAPRKLTSMGAQMEGLAWARDGKTLVFGSVQGMFRYVFRVAVDGRTPAERLEVAGLGARGPATAASRDRLVFERSNDDSDIYRLDLRGQERAVSTSSLLERTPVFSPDGRHIAFSSARSGQTLRIWVAAADGSQARELAPEMGSTQWAPAWAPDGRTIAFRSGAQDKQVHIWTIDVEGGNLRQLTTGPGDRRYPSWSRDGTCIYYGEMGATGSNIWRVTAAGGRPEQVTYDGGDRAFETADGKHLVYLREADRKGSAVLILPLGGGSAQQLVDCAYGASAGGQGVYYFPCRAGGPPVPLAVDRSLDVRLIDPVTGRDRPIATLSNISYGDAFWGPRLSPDGKAIVYAKLVSDGGDLMLIENFQ
jgi:Tol biopolymer transport system component/aminoglycoside phosphotransferase (APT) family kinase protein